MGNRVFKEINGYWVGIDNSDDNRFDIIVWEPNSVKKIVEDKQGNIDRIVGDHHHIWSNKAQRLSDWHHTITAPNDKGKLEKQKPHLLKFSSQLKLLQQSDLPKEIKAFIFDDILRKTNIRNLLKKHNFI